MHLNAMMIGLVALAYWATSTATAADVTCVSQSKPCRVAYINGSIVAGDFDRVRALIMQAGGSLTEFRLNSPGGNVAEAIKIGRLFRSQLVSVWAPTNDNGVPSLPADFTGATRTMRICHGPECVCYSACALIWLGAIERIGTIGLHRPSTDAAEFKAMAPQDASATYRHWLTAIADYMKEMEVPQLVIDAMIQTSSAEIVLVSDNQYGLGSPPSIIEWLNASCGAITPDMEQRFHKLWSQRELQGVPKAEREKAAQFIMRYLSIRGCRRDLLGSHRKPL